MVSTLVVARSGLAFTVLDHGFQRVEFGILVVVFLGCWRDRLGLDLLLQFLLINNSGIFGCTWLQSGAL